MSYDIDVIVNRCSHCGKGETTYSSGITANVAPIFLAAGIDIASLCYGMYLDKRAGDLIPTLEATLERMRESPDRFRALNPVNGWGDYDAAIRFLKWLLEMCRAFPDAYVDGSC